MYDVVAIGEILIDFVCKSTDEAGYPMMAAHPGGAPMNFLATLAKYGKRTAQLGKVGNDAFGKLLLGTLSQNGIAAEGIITDQDVFTTLAFVTLDAGGNREFSFARKPGADSMLRGDEIKFSMIDHTTIFHFGTLSLTNEPARTATQKAVAYAKEKQKLITFDPNLRKPLWKSEEEAKIQILWGLSQADIVKISDEEVEFLWGISPEAGAEKLLEEYNVKLVFITCGQDGSLYANRNAIGRVHSPKVHPVDTTGAGDIFGGSSVTRILEIGKAPETLMEDELRSITAFACTTASLSTEIFGGANSVPERQTVESLYSSLL